MKFLELLSSKLNEFLTGYQTDQPVVPVLAETLETLLRSFMSMFILKTPKSNYWKLMWSLKTYLGTEKILILKLGLNYMFLLTKDT